jgi:hypothetical protein
VGLTGPGFTRTANVSGTPYVITAGNATGGDFGNYTITYVAGNLMVLPRALTIRARDLAKIYGMMLDFTGTEFIAENLANTDTVTFARLVSGGQGADAFLGLYPTTISDATGTGLDNYTITYAPGTLQVVLPPSPIIFQDPNGVGGLPAKNPDLVALLPQPDDIADVVGLEVTPAAAEVSLAAVERASERFSAAIAQCERQLEENGDNGAYLSCTGDALEAYADALENPLIKLPPELKATITVIRQAAQRVRAAASSPNSQAAVLEARAAVGELVDFVRQQTALVRAVDPETQALLQQQGQVMTQALQELDLQLVGAVEI